jgi:hypothetical protein
MQLAATAGCLYGVRRYSLMFFIAFIVQLTVAFVLKMRETFNDVTVDEKVCDECRCDGTDGKSVTCEWTIILRDEDFLYKAT